MDTLKELVQFLHPQQRLDIKAVALTHVLSLTGSDEGKSAILALEDLIAAVFQLTRDTNQKVSKDAVMVLINLTAEESNAKQVLSIAQNLPQKFDIVNEAMQQILNKESFLADAWPMVLINLTRVEELAQVVVDEIEANNEYLPKLVSAFTNLEYNNKKAHLHFLSQIFCNLTQTHKARQLFCDSKYDLLNKVLPFASYAESAVRRSGTIGLLKNICFDPTLHEYLLDDKDDILYALLYPLCGPEEFSDEENEKFPIELQYLPETKAREEDAELRKILLESLLQLCATKRFRELLRSKGVYEILREYHKWEAKVGKDKLCLLGCENVVDILIKKEVEIGLNNYKEVEVPQDLAEDFHKEDMAYLKDLVLN